VRLLVRLGNELEADAAGVVCCVYFFGCLEVEGYLEAICGDGYFAGDCFLVWNEGGVGFFYFSREVDGGEWCLECCLWADGFCLEIEVLV